MNFLALSNRLALVYESPLFFSLCFCWCTAALLFHSQTSLVMLLQWLHQRILPGAFIVENFFSSFCLAGQMLCFLVSYAMCHQHYYFFFIRVLQRSLFLGNWLPGLCYSFKMTCFICTCFLFLLVFQSCQRGRKICRVACYLFLFYLLKCLLFTLYRHTCHCEWRALHRVFRPQIF